MREPLPSPAAEVSYQLNPPLPNDDLNRLYRDSWPQHQSRDFRDVLRRSLAYVCARVDGRLIGFAYLAWDGGDHAFLLDPTVDPAWRRRGIGRRLVTEVVEAARLGGCEWVHVDYEPALEGFYQSCGFRPTLAGLIRVREPKT
jgi:GNAT superfamily N-acetyltransferase